MKLTISNRCVTDSHLPGLFSLDQFTLFQKHTDSPAGLLVTTLLIITENVPLYQIAKAQTITIITILFYTKIFYLNEMFRLHHVLCLFFHFVPILYACGGGLLL